MNDRFKFRAWNKLSNEMKDVQSLNINQEFPDCSNVILETNTFDAIKTHNKPITCAVGLDNVILMQCTGLKDKSGKLIYEGDIVKLDDELNCIAQLHNKYDMDYGRIEFILIGGHPKCPTIYIPTVANESEVIGNIYENGIF